MTFNRETFKSPPPQPYDSSDDAKIRRIAKEEVSALLKDEEILLAFKEKLKAEIKDEILSELRLKQQE